MRKTLLSSLIMAFVVGIGATGGASAVGTDVKDASAVSPRAGTPDYMIGHGPMTSQQRGNVARDFVTKWGPYYHSTYKQPIAAWAQKQAQIIGTADPQNLRSAMRKTTLEAAMMAIRGHQVSDDQAIDFLARQPAHGPGQLPAALGDLAKDVVYTPVTPCRIFDTRVVGGPLASGATTNFDTYPWGGRTGFELQGGKANTNCGMISKAAAVAINIAAPLPEVGGYLTVYPHNTSRPLASNLDYKAGELKNNEVVVRIGDGAWDINVYAHGKTHLVGDVVGYYAAPVATALDCLTVNGGRTVPVGGVGHQQPVECPVGYMATGGSASWNRGADKGRTDSIAGIGNRWVGIGWNEGTQVQTLDVDVRCCRVPGR